MLYVYYGLSEDKTNELLNRGVAKVSNNIVFTFEDLEESEELGCFNKYSIFEFIRNLDDGG